MSMTTEQKQIAIAEFEGWRELRDGRWKNAETGIVERFLPPYLTSRDAICGAVEKLDENQFDNFVFYLQKVTKSIPLGSNALRKILLATPAQITDALLLTLRYQI